MALSLLVMLCFCLSAAQVLGSTEDGVSKNDILEEGSHSEIDHANRAPTDELQAASEASESPQVTSLSHIYSALTDMNVKMGELKAELRYTQAELQAMEARLKAKETQVDELRTQNEG